MYLLFQRGVDTCTLSGEVYIPRKRMEMREIEFYESYRVLDKGNRGTQRLSERYNQVWFDKLLQVVTCNEGLELAAVQ